MTRLTLKLALFMTLLFGGLYGAARAAAPLLPYADELGYVVNQGGETGSLLLRDVARETTITLDEEMLVHSTWLWSPDRDFYVSYIYSDFTIHNLNGLQLFDPHSSFFIPQPEHWTPDARLLVCSVQPGENGNQDMYVLDVRAGAQQRLTNTPDIDERHALWSVDYRQIYYVASDGIHDVIYVMNADGSDPRVLFESIQRINLLSLSPDGGSLLFGSVTDSPRRLTVINADGSQPVDLIATDVTDARWTPDSRRILLSLDSDTVVVTDPLTQIRRPLFPLEANYNSVVWSPDETQIAFTSDMGGNWSLYAANADGSDPRLLKFDTGTYVGIYWSPDRRQIAFVEFEIDDTQFYLVNADGSGLRSFETGVTWAVPRWRPQ
jgi:Tol biopolymer transport system component